MRHEAPVDGRSRPGQIPPIVALGIVAAVLGGMALLPWVSTRGADQSARRPSAAARKVPKKPSAKPPKKPPVSPPKKPPVSPPINPAVVSTPWVVLGYNDLGMHCMNEDFSEICILPPYNNLHAQVIARGEDPQIITSGAIVSYSIPGNTHSVGKTNFWDYVKALFGVDLPLDVGLTGNKLSGTMTPTGSGDWSATGIPLTPIMDDKTLNAYALSLINVTSGGKTMATTQAVVPVSWEISCNLCHARPGFSVAADILESHDRLHGTDLKNQKPVLCASCHADPALGTAGFPGVSSMSSAMHSAHATRFTPEVLAQIPGGINCYACHPGIKTQCQRDIHYAKGIHCGDCHGTMTDVGNPKRTAWVDEPRCADCHKKQGFAFEEPGKLFKQSRGHNGVMCASCHGSPHAITPTVTDPDNVQAIKTQGHAGTIDNCVVCHKKKPEDQFNHTLHGD